MISSSVPCDGMRFAKKVRVPTRPVGGDFMRFHTLHTINWKFSSDWR